MESQILCGLEGVDSDRMQQPQSICKNVLCDTSSPTLQASPSSSPSQPVLFIINSEVTSHSPPSTSPPIEPVPLINIIEQDEESVQSPTNIESIITAAQSKRVRRFFGTSASRNREDNKFRKSNSNRNSNNNSSSNTNNDLRLEFIKKEMERAEELSATKIQILQKEHESRERRRDEHLKKRIEFIDCSIQSLRALYANANSSQHQQQNAREIVETIHQTKDQHELLDF